jgi:hypothetical protein
LAGELPPAQDGVFIYLQDVPVKPVSGFGTLTVRVMVRGVKDLGGTVLLFEVDSPDVALVSVDAGAMLRGTGREVHCPEPAIWDLYARSWCFSIGSAPAGASGEGELALVTLRPERAGEFRIKLASAELVSTDNKPIAVRATMGGRVSAR